MKTVSPLKLAIVSLCIVAFTGLAGCNRDSSAPAAPEATVQKTSPEEEPVKDAESSTATTAEQEVDRSGQLLRHAVFFQFKEESSEEDIQRVAEAFAALPSKIDTIVDFQWGTNNSPEGFDDGYTHCFLLSFKTAADRDAYIPHPAHAGEFADVLRPHMKSAFVIDYWGTPSDVQIEKPLQHVVFFKFKDDAAAEDIRKVEQAFAELPSKIDAIKGFEWGTNNSPEKNDDGFTHCFLVTFGSEKDREVYLPHPDHTAFVEILEPVLDKVRVLDFTVQ